MPFVFLGNRDLCLGLPNFLLFVIILGEGLWVITYALVIRQAFKDRSYGIPLTATALNYTWEILYAIVYPSPCRVVRLLRYAWLILDSVIVWQLFRYGRKEQRIPDFRRYFYISLLAIFAMAGTEQWTFRKAFQDFGGDEAAYSINLIMSVLFVLLFYARKDGHGLSYGAAWTKMVGTGVLSLMSAISFKSNPNQTNDFMLFLFVTIFLFDILYIGLMHRSRLGLTALKTA